MDYAIVANGKIFDLAEVREEILNADFIIAADGGARYCLQSDIVPDLVVGDFDSLSENVLRRLESLGCKLIKYPREKDETDLELAIDYAAINGGEKLNIYGALGSRMDMTLANIQLIASDKYREMEIWIKDPNTVMRIIRPGDEVIISGKSGDVVSLIPLKGDVEGIVTEGLKYPLQRETLLWGYTRGISNNLISNRAKVSISSGILLSVHQKTNEFVR